MANKKYVSLSKLSTFLDNLRNTFALLIHTHKLSDISDYTIDTALSSVSNNPVANAVLDMKFSEISESMKELEQAVARIPTEIILNSSVEGSNKQFKLTIDDTGTFTVSEIVGE